MTNLFALPLINSVGLFLEESPRRDYLGIFSFMFLIYVLVPFQAYAALKGLFQKEQSPWFRTPKTGHITDAFYRSHFRRWFGMFLPGPRRRPRSTPAVNMSYLKLTTANNRFTEFQIKKRPIKGLAQGIVASLLVLAIIISFFAREVPIALAAPDQFYLEENAASGPTPAGGNYMGTSIMTGTNSVCISVSQLPGCTHDASPNAYWYSEITYPSGGYNGSIPAGSYNLHMHWQTTNTLLTYGSYRLAGSHDFQMAAGTKVNMNFSVGLCNTNTACSGGNYTEIVVNSNSYNLTSATSSNVDLGSGSAINLNTPQGSKRLRFTARAISNNSGAWFILYYNGSASVADTYVTTPTIVVPEKIWVLIAVIPFLPWLVRKILMKKQRLRGT